MDSSVLEVVAARMTLNPGARALVATMRAGGAYCALVSGGFTCFTESIRAACGLDEARANCLEVADGRITGKVPDPVLGRPDRTSTRLTSRHKCAMRMHA